MSESKVWVYVKAALASAEDAAVKVALARALPNTPALLDLANAACGESSQDIADALKAVSRLEREHAALLVAHQAAVLAAHQFQLRATGHGGTAEEWQRAADGLYAALYASIEVLGQPT